MVTNYLDGINRKIPLDEDKIIELKQYYLSMYRFYMLRLYNKGYIDDPTVFDDKLIRRNIVELEIKGISDTLGNYLLDSKRVKYALHKNKGEAQQEFLLLLYDVLVYKEYSSSIDSFYEVFPKEISLGIRVVRNELKSSHSIKLNKANLRNLVKLDETIEEYSIKKFQILKILENIGVESVDYCIDKDLTIDDMAELIPVLFGTNPPESLDGEYADVVKNWLKTYNRSIESHLYSHNLYEILDELEKVVLQFDLEDIVAIYRDTVFVKKPIEYRFYPLGFFGVIGGYNGDSLYEGDYLVNGFTGEGYTTDYLDSEGYSYMGVPVKVGDYYVFDREQTNIENVSWFKSEEVDFTFEDETIVGCIENEEQAIKSSLEGNLGILKL